MTSSASAATLLSRNNVAWCQEGNCSICVKQTPWQTRGERLAPGGRRERGWVAEVSPYHLGEEKWIYAVSCPIVLLLTQPDLLYKINRFKWHLYILFIIIYLCIYYVHYAVAVAQSLLLLCALFLSLLHNIRRYYMLHACCCAILRRRPDNDKVRSDWSKDCHGALMQGWNVCWPEKNKFIYLKSKRSFSPVAVVTVTVWIIGHHFVVFVKWQTSMWKKWYGLLSKLQ